jgi:hypothetical protein
VVQLRHLPVKARGHSCHANDLNVRVVVVDAVEHSLREILNEACAAQPHYLRFCRTARAADGGTTPLRL